MTINWEADPPIPDLTCPIWGIISESSGTINPYFFHRNILRVVPVVP
jgi:hypothetical protein